MDIDDARDDIMKLYDQLSSQGFRTLGVAYKDMDVTSHISKDDEKDMTFIGVIVLYDPPKPGVMEAIESLRKMGVSLKVITGDNRLVAAYINRTVCMSKEQLESNDQSCNRVVTGSELNQMSDAALIRIISDVNVFAEVEPNQKERIILHMKKAGNVVGYMGDGINDGPALHAADVGISVDSAVDVAKEAAQIVLLEKDLGVLAKGVKEGRTTFANTLKYVFMATSANFGNMFSMAGASLLLPFLPLLPKQILLTNLMTDLPEMTIATDTVDPELVDRPRRWNIDFIRKFMITFGLLSSIFDFMTFGVLIFVLHASEGSIPDGLVHGIRRLCVHDRAGDTYAQAILYQPAEPLFVCRHDARYRHRRRAAVHAASRDIRLPAATAVVHTGHVLYRRRIRVHGRSHKKAVLSFREILDERYDLKSYVYSAPTAAR